MVNTSPCPTPFMKAPATQLQERTAPPVHQSFSQTKQDTGFGESVLCPAPHTAPRCFESNLLSNGTVAKGTLRIHSQHGHSHHPWPRLALPVPSLLQPRLLLLQGQGLESWSEANQLGHPDIPGHRTCGQDHSVVGLPGIHEMETALTLNILKLFCASCSRLFKAKCMRCLFLEGQSIEGFKGSGLACSPHIFIHPVPKRAGT